MMLINTASNFVLQNVLISTDKIAYRMNLASKDCLSVTISDLAIIVVPRASPEPYTLRRRVSDDGKQLITITFSIVAGISLSGATTPTHLSSFDAGGDWASQRRHAVQDLHNDSNSGGTTLIFAKA